MAQPSPSWNTVPIRGTWRRLNGTSAVATWKLESTARVVSAVDDVIIRKGVVATGTLGGETGSLLVDAPAVDDPDVSPNGFELVLTVSFSLADGGGQEVYRLQPSLSQLPGGINLRQVVLPQEIPASTPALIRGVPGGIAELDADGDVVDADGQKVAGGGTSGPVAVADVVGLQGALNARLALGSVAVQVFYVPAAGGYRGRNPATGALDVPVASGAFVHAVGPADKDPFALHAVDQNSLWDVTA